MKAQNYSNYSRYVPGYHFLLTALLALGTIGSVVNIFRHKPNAGGFVSDLLIILLFVCASLIFYFMRVFPLKVQDRAIRAEESLRYFILAGKAIPGSITMQQIIALRFAADEEFVALADKAATENLSPDAIKSSVKNWRADNYRA